MKRVLLIMSAAIAMNVQAASVTITSNPLAQETLGIMSDQGGSFRNVGTNGLQEMKLKNFHCDFRHRGALGPEDTLAGVPTQICRKNSKNVQGTEEGKLYRDGRALAKILDTLQNEPGAKVIFTDCASGYCGTFAKSIVCQVNTKIETFSEGRFSCTFTDDQP